MLFRSKANFLERPTILRESDTNESEDSGDELEEGIPKDHLWMLTPVPDILRRIDPEEFISFVSSVDQLIEGYFSNIPLSEGIKFQVCCALLPGGKKLIETQVEPSSFSSPELNAVAETINRIAVNSVTDGPVAFLKRSVFGEITRDYGEITFPFASYFPLADHLPHSGSVPLDDFLMFLAGVDYPRKSLWTRLRAYFKKESNPGRKLEDKDFAEKLCRRIPDRSVLFCNYPLEVRHSTK